MAAFFIWHYQRKGRWFRASGLLAWPSVPLAGSCVGNHPTSSDFVRRLFRRNKFQDLSQSRHEADIATDEPEAARQLDELPKSMRARIHAVLGRLQQWPEVSGAKPLTGNLAGHFRVRTGDDRIQFSVTPDTLIVERFGHRDGFYEG